MRAAVERARDIAQGAREAAVRLFVCRRRGHDLVRPELLQYGALCRRCLEYVPDPMLADTPQNDTSQADLSQLAERIQGLGGWLVAERVGGFWYLSASGLAGEPVHTVGPDLRAALTELEKGLGL